jgi:hypothetical protein
MNRNSCQGREDALCDGFNIMGLIGLSTIEILLGNNAAILDYEKAADPWK